jgi:hypothetical protein
MNFLFSFAFRGQFRITFVVSVKSKRHAFLAPCETNHSISIHTTPISSTKNHLTDRYLPVMSATVVGRKVNQS